MACVILGMSMILSSACGRGVPDGLAEIETCIEERPADALSALEAMDPSTLQGRAAKAGYALLMSMALDKNYVDKDDFGILQPAIDYYPKKGTPTEKMRTSYYQGRIYSNRGEMSSAMRCWIQAVEEGEKSDDVLTRARVYYAMGNVYSRLFQWDKYVDTYIRAAELFEAGGADRSYHNSILRVAAGYAALGDKEQAEAWLDKARALYDAMSASSRSTYYSTCLTYLTTFGLVDEIPGVLAAYLGSGLDVDWLSVANGYVHTGDFDAAKQAIDREDSYEGNEGRTVRYWTLRSQICEGLGDEEGALDAYRRYITYNDAYSAAIHSYDMQFMEQKYELESKVLRSDKAKWIAITLALAALALALAVAMLLNRRIEAQKRERDNYKLLLNQAELEKERLEKILMMRPDDASRARINERLDVLNQLLVADIMRDSEMEVEASSRLRDFYEDKDGFMDSTRMIYSVSHPGFIEYLKNMGLDDTEINYCCLYALGMNGKDVMTFLDKGGAYNIASKIRKQLGLDGQKTNLNKYIQNLLLEKG